MQFIKNFKFKIKDVIFIYLKISIVKCRILALVLNILAFLHPHDILNAFDELRINMPAEANDIMEWFETYYIRGRVKRTTRSGSITRSEPIFPPSLWSVVDNLEYAFLRTQNSVEGWHRRWETLVGHAH